MQKVEDEFDFEAWSAVSYSRPRNFHEVLATAVERLVVGRGDLRDRLSSALFCFCLGAAELEVPAEFRERFDEIIASVNRPLDFQTDIGGWRAGVRRMRFKKADQIAWKLWALFRVARRGGN